MFIRKGSVKCKSIVFQNWDDVGLSIMLGRVKYYQSVTYEDLEKMARENEGVPKLLQHPLFR